MQKAAFTPSVRPLKMALGLGTSLGPRRANLLKAVYRIGATAGIEHLKLSRWYHSPPMKGGHARGHFLNAVLLINSALSPLHMLALCRDLEDEAGRRRAHYWGDRTLDLDILHIEGLRSTDPTLTLPHPGVAERAFVLNPLLEVWPTAINPLTGRPWRDSPCPTGPKPIPIGLESFRRFPTLGVNR